jgi:alpha-tubulin suppressor-like RCC1 family protein
MWVVKLTNESQQSKQEDVFMIESVQQVVIGTDFFMAFDQPETEQEQPVNLFVQFIFKHRTDLLYVVFEST